MDKNVMEISTIELKAIAYDLTKQFQFIQNQLSIIEQELIKRAQLADQPSNSNTTISELTPS